MTKILMVCLGNICRSPLAHGILQSKLPSDRFYVDSAGTGNYHIGKMPDKRSVNIAQSSDIDISNQKCRQFITSDFDYFDWIYVMDQSNYNDIVNLTNNPHHISKVKLILDKNHFPFNEVPDPYYGDEKDFVNVFEILVTACDSITLDLLENK